MSTMLRTDNRLATPGPRPVVRDGAGNGRGHWDWFYDLPAREQNRLRYYMTPGGLEPDEWAATNDFDDVESAMSYWRGLVQEARSEWDDWEEPEPEDGFTARLIECDDDEWAYILGQLARRRTYGVQATLGVVDHELPDEVATPIRVPKSVSLMGCGELAALVGVKPNTIVQWCRRSKMPAPSEIMGGRRYWTRAVAVEWAESHKG